MIKLSKIPTYIVNLKKRTDRRKHVLNEFKNKNEFDIKIVEAHEHVIGSYGFWKTICEIISTAKNGKEDFVLICEDDHEFTSNYCHELLIDSINMAHNFEADLLCGGVSWFNGAIPVTKNLYWVDAYNGNQFIIIFKSLFDRILNSKFYTNETTDFKLSNLAARKFFIFPFLSIQKEFGYSDVTPSNDELGHISKLFVDCSNTVHTLNKVADYFYSHPAESTNTSFDNICIPTYVINLPERIDRRSHIIEQFKGKPEFDVKIINAVKHPIGAVGLWKTIRNIISIGIENDDEIIIICEDDHQFTTNYSKHTLFKNIFEAYNQGTDYLSGGSGGVHHPIPISHARFWGAECLSTQFIVVYKRFFHTILNEKFDDSVRADIMLSSITANKMVLFPFISMQKEFGYSDVTSLHNNEKGIVSNLFAKSENKLRRIQKAYMEFMTNQK